MSTHLLAFLLLTQFRDGVDFKSLVQAFKTAKQTILLHNKDIGFSGDLEDVVMHAAKLLGPHLVAITDKTNRRLVMGVYILWRSFCYVVICINAIRIILIQHLICKHTIMSFNVNLRKISIRDQISDIWHQVTEFPHDLTFVALRMTMYSQMTSPWPQWHHFLMCLNCHTTQMVWHQYLFWKV